MTRETVRAAGAFNRSGAARTAPQVVCTARRSPPRSPLRGGPAEQCAHLRGWSGRIPGRTHSTVAGLDRRNRRDRGIEGRARRHTGTETYLPAFIPIGDTCAGDYLAVDTRSGDRHGCVVEFFGEGCVSDRWDSIDPMLDLHLRRRSNKARTARDGSRSSEDGHLHWDFP